MSAVSSDPSAEILEEAGIPQRTTRVVAERPGHRVVTNSSHWPLASTGLISAGLLGSAVANAMRRQEEDLRRALAASWQTFDQLTLLLDEWQRAIDDGRREVRRVIASQRRRRNGRRWGH